MPDNRIGTREEWQAARDELARLEAEQAQRNEEVTRKRRELPWVAVKKEYEFDTEDGKKTLAELFDGRSQLLAYNIMFGPDYTLGACPGCTSLGDGLDGSLIHLSHRDVTLICFSRAPIERLSAYKRRMGWQFPYVSTYNIDLKTMACQPSTGLRTLLARLDRPRLPPEILSPMLARAACLASSSGVSCTRHGSRLLLTIKATYGDFCFRPL
jgi:predicted dithiol-disulfide oxidoreductase (DUF899 family)